MKAIQVTQTGGPEVMSIREVPTPVPGPGEVLIRVAASGVNFIDLYVREGRYANPVPFIPGQEASGTIAALGEGVRSIKEGDRVAWCSILGTYAEFALAPADRVVPIPADISFDQAAAVMLQGMTAHYLSHSAYPIRKEDAILVHAGAGGVGLLLTQMAKTLGARVTATVSTREKKDQRCWPADEGGVRFRGKDHLFEIAHMSGGTGNHCSLWHGRWKGAAVRSGDAR